MNRRVAQVERANWPAAASHPCHKLRRRSGRRCLCRPTSRMALAPNRPPPSSSSASSASSAFNESPQSTTFVRASHQTTTLVRASDPVPTLRSCVPRNPRHTTASPGPPSLAARLWRSFDGGVGKERTSKAIASPRAQERIEPVACRQKSSRLSLNPTPPEAAPPDPSSRTAKCSRRYGRSVSVRTRTAQVGCRKESRQRPTPTEGAARLPSV
jgi:hypothetical protein